MPYAPQALYDYNDLMQQMLETNANYLAISVGFLIFIGGFFYIINIKPFQDNLKELDKKISFLTTEVSLQTEKNKLLETKINHEFKLNQKKLLAMKNNLENKFGELDDRTSSIQDDLMNETQKLGEKLEKKITIKTSEVAWQVYWDAYNKSKSEGTHFVSFLCLGASLENAHSAESQWRIQSVIDAIDEHLEKSITELEKDADWKVWSERMLVRLKKLEQTDKVKKIILSLEASLI